MVLRIVARKATKTRIMYAAYLSHSQAVEYLEYLQQNEMIAYEQENGLYGLTEKGIKLLKVSNQINDMAPVKDAQSNDEFYF